MLSLLRAVLAAAACALGGCGHAATVTATPATLGSALDQARGGDVVALALGDYAPIAIRGKTWSPSVTIDASAARLASVRIDRTSGLTWRGGSFNGHNTERNGVAVQISDHIAIENTTMTSFLRNGIGFHTVSDGRIIGNKIVGSGSDGIDIALSRRIFIDRNTCLDTQPTQGAHPDCIQMWSRPTQPPTSDITITNNSVNGYTQGITGFNGVHNDLPDGGFDRIRIEDNIVEVSLWHGISLYNCRSCIVRNNRISTLPNGRVRAKLTFIDSDVLACGNVITSFPDSEATKKCTK